MEYIKEYGIFDFFKKKKGQVAERVKDIFVRFNKSYLVSNNVNPSKVLFVKSKGDKYRDLIQTNDNKPEYLIVKEREDGSLYISFWGYIPSHYSSSSEYVCHDILIKLIDDNLSFFGICKGQSVYIEDLNANGTIVDLCYAIFAEYDVSREIRENGMISKVLVIESMGKKYYRLPSQVTILKEVPDINLAPEFRDIIEDYLLDATESGKFTIEVIPSVENTLAVFNVSIMFSTVIDLQTASYFFSTINTLKKRLQLIDNCDISIEDLTKRGIKIKISKQPVKEGFIIKEYAFWNKDNKLGDKILKNLNLVNPKDIDYQYVSAGYSGGPVYTFNLKDFNIVCKRESDEHDNFLQGYSVIVDGVELDISGIQARKIFKKVKEIYERPKKEDDDYIRKDLGITLENNVENECEMCGEPIFNDQCICSNCMSKSEIEIEQPKEKKVVLCDGVPAYPRSQQIYHESSKTFRNVSYDYVEEWIEERHVDNMYDSDVKFIVNIFKDSGVEIEVDRLEDNTISVIIPFDENCGIAIVIKKYNDEYYWITIYDSVTKSGDIWEDSPFSDNHEVICDQLHGVEDAIKYYIKFV